MRKLLIAAMAALPLAVFAAPPKTITRDVQNMTCDPCPITVKNSLQQVAGLSAAQIDFDKKTATVTYDPGRGRPEELTKATSNAGYPSAARGTPQ